MVEGKGGRRRDKWQSRLLMSTLHFSDGRDTDVSEEGDGVAAGLRAAVFTFLLSALSNPTFLRLREKSFPAVIKVQAGADALAKWPAVKNITKLNPWE